MNIAYNLPFYVIGGALILMNIVLFYMWVRTNKALKIERNKYTEVN